METNSAVEIHRVANGFVVRPPQGLVDQRFIVSSDDVFCFETFYKLSCWLDQHFVYEQCASATDGD